MNDKGFTLLETVIYLALCGLLLGGLLPVAYQLAAAADRDTASAARMNEAAFIDRKLYWAIASATEAAVPSPSSLVVTMLNGETFKSVILTFAFNDDTRTVARAAVLTITRGDALASPNGAMQATALNAPSFPITDAAFALQRDEHDAPVAVTVTFTVDSTRFAFRYPLPRHGMFPISCAKP